MTYNALVDKVDAYIRDQRARGTVVGRLLPRRIFAPRLWRWEREGVATGAGWGVAVAFAPLPLQTIFAAAACVWRRGNIPLGVLACWASFPGYQVFAWPIQWYVGALLFRALDFGSGASFPLIAHAVRQLPQGWEAVVAPLRGISLPLLAGELIVGCFVTCAILGLLVRALVLLIWRADPNARPRRRFAR